MSNAVGKPFLLFVAGAVLYAVALTLCTRDDVGGLLDLLVLLTPVFGLPYLMFGRPGWRIVAYLLVLVPAFHWCAIYAALHAAQLPVIGSPMTESMGLVGGSVGGVLSLAALLMLRPPGRPARTLLVVVGAALLALLGGVGMAAERVLSETTLGDHALVIAVYLPWQIAFGLILSLYLGPLARRRGRFGEACPQPTGTA